MKTVKHKTANSINKIWTAEFQNTGTKHTWCQEKRKKSISASGTYLAAHDLAPVGSCPHECSLQTTWNRYRSLVLVIILHYSTVLTVILMGKLFKCYQQSIWMEKCSNTVVSHSKMPLPFDIHYHLQVSKQFLIVKEGKFQNYNIMLPWQIITLQTTNPSWRIFPVISSTLLFVSTNIIVLFSFSEPISWSRSRSL